MKKPRFRVIVTSSNAATGFDLYGRFQGFSMKTYTLVERYGNF